MKRVVIVHAQEDLASRCQTALESAGYEISTCRGPQPAGSSCHIMEDGCCSLCESGDLLVYDPWLHEDLGAQGAAPILAILRRRYAQKPIVVLGEPLEAPLGVATLAADDPGVSFASPDNVDSLRRAVRQLATDDGFNARPPARWAPPRYEQDPGLYWAADCPYCD